MYSSRENCCCRQPPASNTRSGSESGSLCVFLRAKLKFPPMYIQRNHTAVTACRCLRERRGLWSQSTAVDGCCSRDQNKREDAWSVQRVYAEVCVLYNNRRSTSTTPRCLILSGNYAIVVFYVYIRMGGLTWHMLQFVRYL